MLSRNRKIFYCLLLMSSLVITLMFANISSVSAHSKGDSGSELFLDSYGVDQGSFTPCFTTIADRTYSDGTPLTSFVLYQIMSDSTPKVLEDIKIDMNRWMNDANYSVSHFLINTNLQERSTNSFGVVGDLCHNFKNDDAEGNPYKILVRAYYGGCTDKIVNSDANAQCSYVDSKDNYFTFNNQGHVQDFHNEDCTNTILQSLCDSTKVNTTSSSNQDSLDINPADV